METAVFIGTVVAGITELIKQVRLKAWDSVVTIVSAVLVGALVGALDGPLGLPNISVALGISVAFGAVGVVATAKKIG